MVATRKEKSPTGLFSFRIATTTKNNNTGCENFGFRCSPMDITKQAKDSLTTYLPIKSPAARKCQWKDKEGANGTKYDGIQDFCAFILVATISWTYFCVDTVVSQPYTFSRASPQSKKSTRIALPTTEFPDKRPQSKICSIDLALKNTCILDTYKNHTWN